MDLVSVTSPIGFLRRCCDSSSLRHLGSDDVLTLVHFKSGERIMDETEAVQGDAAADTANDYTDPVRHPPAT